jgi:hypothetical protein
MAAKRRRYGSGSLNTSTRKRLAERACRNLYEDSTAAKRKACVATMLKQSDGYIMRVAYDRYGK